MKICWGICNFRVQCIWFNLELVKKFLVCLEYVVVYEMIYLLEFKYNDCFWGFIDSFYLQW